MASKTSAPKQPRPAPKKAPPAARKTPKAAAAEAASKPATKPAPAAKARLPAKLPSARKVVRSVAKAIETSPVGKAGALTSAVLRTRRAGLLSRRVRNKIVVVTGASSGIGEDCALKLAAAGATVILAARTPQKLHDTLAKIEARGGKAFAYACDLSDMADCERFIEKVLAEHRHVDILINNAGRSIRRSVKASFDRFHVFERTMQLNYFGALKLIFGFAPMMLARKSGHIINISSIGVLASPPRFSAYVASKAALDAFSWCAAPEFADANVRFTTINMPLVRTPMIAPTGIYENVPTLTPEEAADLVVEAIVYRPVRIATRLGISVRISHAVAPRLTQILLNTAFNMFPDSSAAQGRKEGAARAPLTAEQMAFAQLTQGIHW